MAVSVQFPAAKAHATLKQVQAFQQAIEDHRYLSEYVANVQQSTALFRESEPRERLASMRAFLAEHVVGHFAFEESDVFPQLLAKEAAPSTRRAVEELVAEHKAMMGSVRRLRRKMRGIRAPGSARRSGEPGSVVPGFSARPAGARDQGGQPPAVGEAVPPPRGSPDMSRPGVPAARVKRAAGRGSC